MQSPQKTALLALAAAYAAVATLTAGQTAVAQTQQGACRASPNPPSNLETARRMIAAAFGGDPAAVAQLVDSDAVFLDGEDGSTMQAEQLIQQAAQVRAAGQANKIAFRIVSNQALKDAIAIKIEADGEEALVAFHIENGCILGGAYF